MANNWIDSELKVLRQEKTIHVMKGKVAHYVKEKSESTEYGCYETNLWRGSKRPYYT